MSLRPRGLVGGERFELVTELLLWLRFRIAVLTDLPILADKLPEFL